MRFLILLLCTALAHAEGWEPLKVVATAYCPCAICCGVRAAGVTANNTKVSDVPYGIASDPRRLPYGTLVWIPHGNGYLDKSFPVDNEDRQFYVDDTGGLLRTRTRTTGTIHIDLRYVHHSNALKFGKKTITIYVWKD